MRCFKVISVVGLIIHILGLSLPRAVLAYGVETHAALTQETAHFFNRHFSNRALSDGEIQLLMDGARHEDEMPRWMNHFYDPINKNGLHFVRTWHSSKEWVHDAIAQTDTLYNPIRGTVAGAILGLIRPDELLTTDYTWERAINDFAKGNRERGLKALGHVLHLIEDITVPAHTRDDSHPEIEFGNYNFGDPDTYEDWTHKFVVGSDLGLQTILERKRVIIYPTIDLFFDELALYTNTHFLSDDTLGTEFYNKPVPIPTEAEASAITNFRYNRNRDEDGFYVLSREPATAGIVVTTKDKIVLNDPRVLSDYWSRLSTKAVQYGAGVIDLFFKEAEKAKKEKEAEALRQAQGKSGVQRFFAQVADAVGGLLGINRRTDAELNAEPAQNNLGTSDVQDNDANQGIDSNVDQSLGDPTSGIPDFNVEEVGSPAGEQTPAGEPNAELDSRRSLPQTAIGGGNDNGEVAPSVAQGRVDAFGNPMPQDSGGGYSHTGRAPEETNNQQQTTNNQSSGGSASGDADASDTTDTSDTIDTTDTATATTTAATTTPSVVANHAVISEVQLSGVDAGDEFIELYNPTDAAVDLSGWSIQYLSGSASSAANISKKNFEAGATIPAKGFFLIARATTTSGNDGYRNIPTPDMTHRTFSLSGAETGATIFLANDQEKITGSDDANIIDRLAYGTGAGLMPEVAAASLPHSSLERRAVSGGECISPIGLIGLIGPMGEFGGNACDRDDNSRDFALRATPNPQNAQNLSEPRSAPAAPANLQFNYATSTLDLSIQWTPSADAAGATSTVAYAATSSIGLIGRISPISTKTQKLSEIGRDYAFQLSAADRDGLRSATTTATTTVPGLFDSWYFWAPSSSSYAIDANLPIFPGGVNPETFNILVFYANREPTAIPLFYADMQYASLSADDPARAYGEWGSSVGDAQPVVYQNCAGGTSTTTSLLIPGRRDICQPAQPGIRGTAIHSDSLEDRRLRTSIYRGSTSIDYLTTGVYTYQGFNQQALVVRDVKHYGATGAPINQPPTAPSDIQFSYDTDEATTTVTVSWLPSTDPDSLDTGIIYEWRATIGSSTLPDTWRQVELWGGPGSDVRRMMRVPRALGQAHVFEIRAKDNQGAASAAGGATLFLPPLETCAERATANPYFAIDCIEKTGNQIKIRWRLLANPGEGSVWGILPYLSSREAAPSTGRALHRSPNGNPDYQKTTFKTTVQCNENITHLDDYRVNRQYLTKFTELSGLAASSVVQGAAVKFSMFRGSPCAINSAADQPFYIDTAEYVVE